MVYTVKMRKALNDRFLSETGIVDFLMVRFSQIERLRILKLPEHAIMLESDRYAEIVSAQYWISNRRPMPIMVLVRNDCRKYDYEYDVNYVNPNNPHDMALLSRYISHTEVYAMCN